MSEYSHCCQCQNSDCLTVIANDGRRFCFECMRAWYEDQRRRVSQQGNEIHTLRQRVQSITRECEELRQTITDRTNIAARLVAEKDALRAELAAIKAMVPYRVENVEPGVSVDASPVVRHFDMTKPEPESEE